MLTSPSTTSSQDSSAAGNALTVAADLSAAVASSHQHHHGSATASSSSAPLSPHGHGHHHGHHHDHDHALAAATSEHPDRDADLDPPLFADEDQDMSEGGVPLSDLYHDDLLLTLPPSSELAMLSTQVLLPLNPIDLDDFFAHAHHYHAAHNGPPPYASATAQVLEPAGDFDDEDDDDLYDDFESPPEGTHLLTAMQVSQELELLQDIHDNGGFLFGADGPPDIDAEHSTPPSLFLSCLLAFCLSSLPCYLLVGDLYATSGGRTCFHNPPPSLTNLQASGWAGSSLHPIPLLPDDLLYKTSLHMMSYLMLTNLKWRTSLITAWWTSSTPGEELSSGRMGPPRNHPGPRRSQPS